MEDVAKITGLIRRENTYYVRVRVPKDLLHLYAPKKEITKSLGTKNYSDAVLKYKHEQASIQADFELKRKSAPNGKPPIDMLPTLSEETLKSFAQDWCERAWQNALKDHATQKKTYSPDERDEIRDNLFMEKALAEDEVSNIRKVASTGYYSGNFSKYYSRHLKKLKVKTKKTSFHSYRHNFRDAEREAEIHL